MIFKLHSAFALGLIALAAGTYLITKLRSEGMCCKGFARVVGWFIVITAFLGLICITYNGIMYSKDGRMGYGRGMMRGKGKCPMMEMMKKVKEHPAKTE